MHLGGVNFNFFARIDALCAVIFNVCLFIVKRKCSAPAALSPWLTFLFDIMKSLQVLVPFYMTDEIILVFQLSIIFGNN